VTLGTAVSNVTFSSIPSTYRDLRVVFRGNLTTGVTGASVFAQIQGSGASFTNVRMTGNGSTTASGTESNARCAFYEGNGLEPTSAGNFIGEIMDYSATDKHKTLLFRSNNIATSAGSTEAVALRWANTSAVTSIGFGTGSGTFAVGCTFALYGVIA
jgi:hypothetical protein